MLRALAAVPAVPLPRQPVAIALEDDTLTGGTWLGRRGRYWADLMAMVREGCYIWGGAWEIVDWGGGIGPSCRSGDALRYYVTWLATTEPRSLEMPYPYLQTRVERKLNTWDVNRRQSEVDDHSETYPMTHDGPHLLFNVRVPPGWYYLSFYDFNKDGHTDSNRLRDYIVSVRSRGYRDNVGRIDGFDQLAELAHGRIHDFWGGVWSRFLVHGPAVYAIRINRNYSFCTILAAMTLDTLDEFPPPYRGTPEQWLVDQNEQRKRVAREQASGEWNNLTSAASEDGLANLLLGRLEDLRLTNAVWWAANGRGDYISLLRWYRAHVGGGAPPRAKALASASTCCYRLGLFAEWEEWQKREGLQSAREIEQHLRSEPGATSEAQKEGGGREFEIVSEYLASHTASDR
jgi:hypothetical protein